jgi:hypothetical protein
MLGIMNAIRNMTSLPDDIQLMSINMEDVKKLKELLNRYPSLKKFLQLREGSAGSGISLGPGVSEMKGSLIIKICDKFWD